MELATLPQAWEHDFFVGHQTQQDYFLKTITSDTLHHGFLFEGPDGIGKRTFAFRLARFLIHYGDHFSKKDIEPSLFGETNLPNEMPTSLDVHLSNLKNAQISQLTYPDLLYIGRDHPEYEEEKASVSVDAIRKLNHFLSLTASQAAWRIIIIDGIETLTINAQNALLKLLEEPPEKTLFLLITSAPALLLPTIKSRCQKFKFYSLDESAIKACFDHYYKEKTDLTKMDLSLGSFGVLAKQLEGDCLKPMETFSQLLASYPNFTYTDFNVFFEKYARLKDRALLEMLFGKIESWIHKKLLSETAHLEKWLKAWESFQLTSRSIKRTHLDRPHALLSFLMAL